MASLVLFLSHLVTGVGLSSVQTSEETYPCMLRSGKRYQPEMSEVTELLKAWKEEQEKEKEEQRAEREEEKRRYKGRLEQQQERFERLIEGLTAERRPRRVEVGPESLKLTKLTESDDIEAFLTTFERAVEAHGVDRDKRAAILAPQLTGKARLAYAAMTDANARDYDRVKAAIFQHYDINEETYRRRFRSIKPLENETPVELAIRVKDLAEKWLRDCRDREAVVDVMVKEQFVEVLPEEVRVWVKERKPRNTQEAGRLAEDYRQARKVELWAPAQKTGVKKGTPGQRGCYSCGQLGHMAKDCSSSGKKVSPSTSKGEDVLKVEKRLKKDEKPFLCYNCGGRGHTSRQCPSDAFFCGAKRLRDHRGKKPLVRQSFRCKGFVEGQYVNDMVLDTGCSRTLVRRELVREDKLNLEKSVTVQCAHGDAVEYPVATVEISGQGRVVIVEAAVSDKLPHSVLLGTDVPELVSWLKSEDQALMVVTRGQAGRRSRSQPGQDRGEHDVALSDSGEVLDSGELVETTSVSGEVAEEPGNKEFRAEAEEGNMGVGLPLQELEEESNLPVDGDVLASEFNLSDDMFVGGEKDKGPRKPRSERRKMRYEHARAQRACVGDLNPAISKEELRKLQDADLMIQDLRELKPDQVVEQDGLWYHLWVKRQPPGQTVKQLLLPKPYHHIVCKLAHSIPIAGHLGRDKTVCRITQRFYWPTVFRDVAEYCRRCPQCQKTARGSQLRVPLVPLPVMKEPFKRIAMDIMGPLPRSRRGNQYILVVCDYATRYPEAIPLRSIDAGTVAEHLMQLFSRVGIPREILSDQGTNFMSQLLKELYNLLNITQIRTSPYHPQTDGLVERFNKTLKSMLRKLVSKEGKNWDSLLPYVLFAYREVPQSTTGFSPFELLYGREVRGPLDVLREEWEVSKKSDESVLSHILQVRERLEEMSELVSENVREAQRCQKLWYDQNTRERVLEPGEEVLVLLPTSSNKLLAKWQGPYRVIRRVGEVNYELSMPDKRRRKAIFHVNMLKKWHQAEDTCLWAASVDSEEEEDTPSWRGESGKSPCVGSQLTEQQKGQLLELLTEFKTVMSGKCGRTSIGQHRIRTVEGLPVRQRPYRMPHIYREAVEKELEMMLEEGVIEPCVSEWASPMVIVKKKDDTIRLCVDYRRLNAGTQLDAYPMPRVEDILDQLGQAKYITTLDLAKGYWQVPVAEEDRHKTAFITTKGLYQFKMMPFGLCGAPATFQRMMDEVIRGMDKFASAYLDDLIVFSYNWEDHLTHLRVMLNRLGEVGLTTKPSKCQLAMAECTYLGHVVGNGVVKPEATKLQTIEQFPLPTTKKQVRSFLGLAGYYRRFIPDYATIAAPLTELIRKYEPERISWSEGCNRAFCELKGRLLSYPVLRNVNFSLPFTLQVDASDVGVGAVLSQIDEEGMDHPVAYFSRKLLPREQKYATVEKECLAIKLGIEKFSVYLMGREFTIQTDHRALQWLSKCQNLNSRLTRWSIALQSYKFKVLHRRGTENANADALSRIPVAIKIRGKGCERSGQIQQAQQPYRD